MLAKLIRVEDETIVHCDKFADEAALAAENERAQEESRGALEWRPTTKEDWYQLGLMGALFACVSFDGGEDDQRDRASA